MSINISRDLRCACEHVCIFVKMCCLRATCFAPPTMQLCEIQYPNNSSFNFFYKAQRASTSLRFCAQLLAERGRKADADALCVAKATGLSLSLSHQVSRLYKVPHILGNEKMLRRSQEKARHSLHGDHTSLKEKMVSAQSVGILLRAGLVHLMHFCRIAGA